MGDAPNLDTVGGRLRDAIQRWGSIRGFSEELQNRGLTGKGATRAMVHRYLDNETTPPLEFFLEAADVLGVREEWLREGEGSRSDAHAVDQAAAAGEWLEEVVDEVGKAAGKYRGALVGSGLRRAMVTHTWRRLIFTERGERLFLDESLPRRIGEALAAPLQALDVAPDSLPEQALDDYLQAATLALRHLHPEPSTPSKSIRTTKPEETDATS